MKFKSFVKFSCLALLVSLNVNSNEVNEFAPNADAGFDQSAKMNEVVKLNASNSTDRDGNRLVYQWRVIGKPENSSTSILNPDNVTTEINIDQPGTYEIELLVADGVGSSSVDTIIVNTDNTGPQIPKLNAQKVLTGDAAYIDGTDVYDPDGDALSLNWTLISKPKKSNAIIQNSKTTSPVVATDAVGKYSVVLHANDYEISKQSEVVNILAVDFFDRSNKTLGCVLDRIFINGFDGLFTNSSPIADVGDDKVGVMGQIIALDGSLSSDADQDSLTYSWSLLSVPNGSSAVIADNDQMMASLTPDTTGDYVAQLIVNDGCLDSNPDSALVTISVNQAPQITSSPELLIREAQAYSYQVTASDPEGHALEYSLTVSPGGSDIDNNGLMTWQSTNEGSYPVTILVTDEYGATDSQSFNLTVTANSDPVIQSFPISSAEQDFDYSYQVVVSDADDDTISYQLINPVAGMAIDANGLITWAPDASGNFNVEVSVGDGYGGTDTQVFTIGVIQLPPNPVDIAPPLSRTDFPPFIETIDFLYESLPPVQVGMPANTIQDYRAAVLKGRALDSGGDPLTGVKVSVNHHPEYGHTYTREDGQYDLVVNGGGTVTVNFEKGGFLPLQRDIRTSWEEFAYSDDVSMIRVDNKVTTIDLSDNTQDFQVAQGSVITDVDGTRQATMLFPSGTGATLQLRDGSSQELTQLKVRATEYTVGDLGLNKMPGDLPGTSGYTYAVELSVDDAINSDALSVDFNQPIPLYVDNFLNFPQGVAVPIGYYDREKAYWVPTPDGLVIKILRIENNHAVLDVTNDGIDNDAGIGELSDLNITTGELLKLAELYDQGKTLWRSQINHFTPFDCNWPYGPPEDIQEPPEEPPFPSPPEIEEDDTPEDEPEEDDDEWECDGCVINAINRTLEEEVPIVGTNFSLKYRSGNNQNDTSVVDSYEIPLTHPIVDPLLKRVELTIYNSEDSWPVTYTYLPSGNLSHIENWGGRDEYKRATHTASINYKIRYFYDAVYIRPRDDRERSFATYWDRGTEVYPSRNDTEVFLEKKNNFKLYRRFNSSLTNTKRSKDDEKKLPLNSVREEQLKLGGWSIENHHVYNPKEGILYKGDGFKRLVTSVNGQVQNYGGNGGSALTAQFDETTEIEEGPDGSIYFHDAALGQIRKINSQGTILRAAGKLHSSFVSCFNDEPVEGENLYDLCLTDIDALHIADNGDIYFSYNKRIRKINRSGEVSTVVGNGEYTSYPDPDGTPALNARINVIDIEISKDGVLYFLERQGLLRFVNTNGNIETVAGGGFIDQFNPIFDGVKATETELFHPNSFALSDDGSIIIADTDHECVRHVTPDGYIYTMPGSASCYITTDEKGGGHEIQSRPIDVSIDESGHVIYLDSYAPSSNLPQVKFAKIYSYGITETLNQNPAGYSGDGEDFSVAELNFPQSFALMSSGELIIADSSNTRIRKVRGDNSIITIGGSEPGLARDKLNSVNVKSKRLLSNNFISARDGSAIYEFNSKGVHLRTLDPLNAKVLVSFDYDTNGLVSSIVDGNGLKTSLIRDSNGILNEISSHYGKTTQLSYFSNGLLKQIKDPLGNYWNMEYLNGNLSAFIDRNKNRYEYTYNSFGLLESDLNPIGGGWQLSTLNDVEGSSTVTMTSSEGRVTEFFKDKTSENGFTKVYVQTNPDNTQETRIIDNFVSEVSMPDGSTSLTTYQEINRFGSQVKLKESVTTKTSLGLSKITSIEIDDDPISLDIITPISQSTKTTKINNTESIFKYDSNIGSFGGFEFISAEGRESMLKLNANKNKESISIADFNALNIEYNAQGKIILASKGDGANKREYKFTYYESGGMAGELHTITNPLLEVYRFEYDLNGQMIKQVLPDLTEINYTYDPNGNLTSLTPPGRPTHFFKYDGMNNETSHELPDLIGLESNKVSFEFNADGQLIKKTRMDGTEIVFNFDAKTGLPTTTITPDGEYTYSYNSVTGLIDSSTSTDGITQEFTFDSFLPISTEFSGAMNASVSRVFDNFYRVKSRSVNGSNTINFEYDDDGLINVAGEMVVDINPLRGVIDGTTLENVTTESIYDSFADLESYGSKFNESSLYSYSLIRDKLSRVKTKNETINGVTTNTEYSYNLTGQLIEEKVNGVVTKTWDYDLNNNRTHVNGINVSVLDDQDRLLSYNGSTFTYTDNGELSTKTEGLNSSNYTYNSFGALKSVINSEGLNIEYLYDSFGRKVAKKLNGTVVKAYIYKDGLNPIAELDGSGAIITRYIYGDKENVPSYMIKNGNKYRIISNHLGSPILVVDSTSGVIEQEISYDVWGYIISDSNPGFQLFGFAGGLYDSDTKLTQFGYREYDASIGRWISQDPIRFASSYENLYAYLNNDPVSTFDKSGLKGSSGFSRPNNPAFNNRDNHSRERWSLREQNRMEKNRRKINTENKSKKNKAETFVDAIEDFVQNGCDIAGTCLQDKYGKVCLAWKCGGPDPGRPQDHSQNATCVPNPKDQSDKSKHGTDYNDGSYFYGDHDMATPRMTGPEGFNLSKNNCKCISGVLLN